MAITDRSGSGRATCQVRSANSDSGQSNASACTSCGSAMVAAPVSTGSVSTRIAPISADGSCSGRHTRSKNRDSGLNASLTVTSLSCGSSRSCSTGALTRVANVSDGSSSTGSRLMVASAAPVSMFVDPGPMLAVTAHACRRSFCLAYAAAVCTIACSLRPNTYRSAGSVPACARLDLGLQQRLTHAGHVAVTEDAEAAGEELAAFAVAFDVLVGQEPDRGLGDGEPHGRLGVR